jgi:NTE family protein
MTGEQRYSGGLGLCLTGGGITGAMYEVGVIAALEDSCEDLKFSAYVGASSGAVVAAALAGGLTAQRMYRALLNPADDFFPLQRHHLLRFDGREIVRVSTSTVGAIRRMIGSVASKPLDVDLWNEIDRFYDSLPAGFFSLEPFERFLDEVFQRRGIPKTFEAMPVPLRIVANDLDMGERVVFGDGAEASVPVSTAVAAACAAPMLYAPVRIGERDLIAAQAGEAGQADVAVDVGCTSVLVVNPMVPIRTDVDVKDVPTGHGKGSRIRDKGLLWVYNQSWRLVAQARLQSGLKTYRAAHPEVQILLHEPERSDTTMFLHSPMNFAARRAILEHGYTTTIQRLRAEGSPLRALLESAGLELTAGSSG